MVCLDTTFLIDVLLGRAVEKFDKILEGDEVVSIASPSIVEIIRGLYLKQNLRNVKQGEKEKINEILFSLTVLSLDKESAILAGEIEADLINDGETIETEDIMIAAIAIKNNEILITRNKKHFGKIKKLKIESY